MMKKNNQNNNWLLGLLKHRYTSLGIAVFLLCGVVDSNRVLAKDDLLKIAQSPAATKENAERVFDEGMKLYQQGSAESLRQAIQKWQEALSLYRVVNDKKNEAKTLVWIGFVYDALGEKQKALDFYNQALPIRRAVGDRRGEATTLNNIGSVYGDLGEKQKALDYYNQALPIIRAVGDRGGEATTLNNIGSVYDDLGEKQKALDFYNQALPIRRAVGDRRGEAVTLHNIGSVYDALGEKQKALDFYNQALPIRRAVGDRRGEATTLNNIGSVYGDLGEKQKALDYYNQALPIIRAVGDRGGEATTLNNIGRVYDDLGEKQKALDFYNQALPILRAVGDRRGEAVTLHNIGSVYDALGEKQKALDFYNQALPIRRAVGDRRGEATTLNNIGSVYDALGEKQKALDFYNQALPIIRAVGDRRGEAKTLNNIGIVYRDTKKPLEAIKNLEQSVDLLLQLRSGVARENRQTFFKSAGSPAIALIDLLITEKQPEKAFTYANLATVADLADYSRLVNVKIANPEAQAAADKWNQHNQQLENLRKELQQKFSEQLSAKVNKLQEDLNKEAENIRNRFVEIADLFETKPTDIAQLQANISPETTVIQPVILNNDIALFLLTRDKIKVIKVPLPAKFDDLLTKTSQLLSNRYSANYLENLEELHKLLISPLEKEIQATKPKQISITATGKLRYIPFEALYDGNQYLMEKYPISYLTRLSSRSLQITTTSNTPSARKVLAFGNPKPNSPLSLDGAESEVKAIIPIFPGSESFMNNKATLSTFKTQIPRFSILHLATHGCFQKGGCTQLKLKENTLLFADESLQIQDAGLLGLQNVELITLSACQTALNTNSNGEEISGLAYLFERAGSKAVIASLWSAADEETKEIMVKFYQNLKQGMRKDEALRQGKLSQIKNNVHPFYWSPFVLIGDGR
ncbi:MAG: tetratricopeptide repeat protein [Aphanizomenon gracile PMC638.10]|nr:tetratricopeptide repeat protein [Aphanizomenon gracile PMC638.10]